MFDELDVVVLGDVALAVVSDPVDDSYAEVFNGSQQVFVSNEISPDGAAIGHLDILREIIEEDSVSELVPVENTVDVLLVLTDPLPEIFMSDLKPELGLEHLPGGPADVALELSVEDDLLWPVELVQ